MNVLAANPLQPLIDVAHAVLRFFHDQAGLSWGLSIIALTVVVRLAILPLSVKQIRSSRAMIRLQPEIKKLQAKYKDDKKRLNEEMMRFYQESGVNPLGSCLPLLLQFPVFISLFYLLRGEEFKQDIAGEESFLFIPDLAAPLTDYPVVLGLMLVLYVGSQLGATLVTPTPTVDKMQRRLFLALPFIFVPFVVNFESGLLLYWITTNFWTLGQQLVIRRFMPHPTAAPTVEATGRTRAKGEREDAPKAAAGGRRGGARAAGRAAVATDGGKQGSSTRNGRAASSNGTGNGSGPKAPPPAPRKRKKRSGRRR